LYGKSIPPIYATHPDNRKLALAKIRVYRYDDEEFPTGKVIRCRGDSFDTLTDHQKTVEIAIRKALPDGANVRSTSIYVWADQQVAKRLWPLSKKRYLYELEIDEVDIRHKGDLNNYSEAETAAKSGKPFEDAVLRYCRGEMAGKKYTEPRVEILVSEATVLGRL
jgi:hypothetical protein